MLKHTREFYLKFFLTFVIFFFVLTYAFVNKNTINEQLDVITTGSSFFAKTATYELLSLNKTKPGFNEETYEIEREIFDNVNLIRADNNLKPLMWDPLLSEIAREHSLDMVEGGYFNHTDILGMGPTERAKLKGIKTVVETKDKVYSGIGENIGFMPRGIVSDVGILIRSDDLAWGMIYKWMLSDPHRENILTEDYLFTGVGVAHDGKGNYYITQDFQ